MQEKKENPAQKDQWVKVHLDGLVTKKPRLKN